LKNPAPNHTASRTSPWLYIYSVTVVGRKNPEIHLMFTIDMSVG